MSGTDELRDVLGRHADSVDDRTAAERVRQVRSRVRAAKRRRRGGGALIAAALVAGTAVGVSTYVDRADGPEPAGPSNEGYVQQELAASPRGVPTTKVYVGSPRTHLRLLFSCPLAESSAELRIQPEQVGTGLPPQTFWEGPCGPDETVLDLEGPGIILSDATYPPGTLASVTITQTAANGAELPARDLQVRIRSLEKADPDDVLFGTYRVPDTLDDGRGGAYELVEVRRSEPGAARFSSDIPAGLVVNGVVGYDANANVSGPGPGTVGFKGPNQVPATGLARGAGDDGGRWTISVDGRPDPDGIIGFALYRKIG